MRSQATRCSQKELAYLSYWQKRGAKFGRNEKIPTSTCIPPCNRIDARDLAWSAAGLLIIAGIGYLRFKGVI
jgi:hypothetical protein